MSTDLRAALRDNRDTLAWLLADQHEQQHDEIDADDNHREKRQRAVDAPTRLIALADARAVPADVERRVECASNICAHCKAVADLRGELDRLTAAAYHPHTESEP